MKNIIIIIILLINSIDANSQNIGELKVYYNAQFNPRFDRGRMDVSYDAQLSISGEKSRFFMVSVEEYNGVDENDLRFIPDTSMQIYVDTSEKKLLSMEHSLNGKSFYIVDSLYPMRWKFLNDTMMIGNFTCKKASCDFRGRHYIAWYTEAIPVPFGPWKMGGLPGLIVDLNDDENNLVIKMQSLVFNKEEIHLPSSIAYSYKEYVQNLKKFLENLKAGGRATSSGNCLTCQNQTTYELSTWEKVF